MAELKEELVHFLAERFQLESGKIEETTDFTADLGLNSMGAVELLNDVETRFHCRIPEHAIPRCVQVKDLLAVIQANGSR